MSKGLKRGFSVAMATAMAMSTMVMPVSAADESKSMSVEYSAETTYTLSIPSKITLLATDATQTTEVGLSAVNTAPTKKIQVKISSGITNNKVELTRANDGETKVVSTVTGKNSAAVSNDFVVAEFKDMSTTATDTNAGELNFSAIADSAGGTVKAGSYTGTIVFEGAVVDR